MFFSEDCSNCKSQVERIVSDVTFARQMIFSTLYIGKSSGKQDYYDPGGYCMACQVKIFWNF